MQPVIGIVGCGSISTIYLENLCRRFNTVRVSACADLDSERARQKAADFPGIRACTTDELMADTEITIVLNLTTPQGHFDIGMQAIQAGKHVYTEKPLALNREAGRALLKAAREANVCIGNAPDTFLGAGIQTCRALIAEGVIGELVGAQGFMLCRGHERWHPDPEFYYQQGGGPLMDMGPYYLTALIALMGPIRRVTGASRISFPQRIITSEKKKGKAINVEVPTHIAGVMDFASGAIGTLTTSFDVCCASVPSIEIFGSKGTLQVPDPNGFGGTVRLRSQGEKEWCEIPLRPGFADNSRGIGVSEMADAIAYGRPHCADGELAYHVLDVMQSILDASTRSRHVEIESTCIQPPPLPARMLDIATAKWPPLPNR